MGLDDVACADSPKIQAIREKDTIQNLLMKNKGNVSQTAMDLGCSRPALYNKMKKYGLK